MDPDYPGELLTRLADGFLLTLQLLGWSLLFATVLGVLLGAMRVSPIPPLRAAGTVYVNIFRNTPLVVIFIFAVVGLPATGVLVTTSFAGLNSFELRAITALSLYTAAFVCEVVRSGVNTVDPGQAEAARSIGMGFGSSLRHVVLPQAMRNVIPPLTSVYIALTKNTSVAAGFGVVEATGQLSNLNEDFPGTLFYSFLGIAIGYILIVAVIVGISKIFEHRVAMAR